MAIKIFLEGSGTPIYRRIINGMARSMEKERHQTITVEPGRESPLEYVRRVNELKPDLVIISNLFGPLSTYSPGEEKYIYELLNSPVVFLHYDNLLGPIGDVSEIKRRLNTLISISGRSLHFFIENNIGSDFQKLSVQNAHKMYHASEFDLIENNGKYRYGVSFVGHLMPESIYLDGMDLNIPIVERAFAAYRKRRGHLDYRIEESAISFADQFIPSRQPAIDWLAAKQKYRAYINKTSQSLRGKIISDIADNFDVDVIGGDSSYMDNLSGTRQLEHPGVHLHMPNHEDTDRIYAESKININITSIQFDSAIVNRVMDIAAVGGFVLTDWKEDLKEITSVYELISYRTVDELKEKIDYYLTHDSERLEIAAQLHRDVKQKCSYDLATEAILGVVTK